MKISSTRNIFFLVFLIVFFIDSTYAQVNTNRNKIFGTVIDGRSQKPLKKYSFKVLPYNREVKTESNGTFILNMPKGNVKLVFDDYPFDKQVADINLKADTSLVITLTSPFTVQYIEEVEVISNKPVNDKPASIDRLDKQSFLTLPALLGERDVVKAISLTAGVSTSSEGSADMQVRGGTHGQNLYLLNDVPLYFTQHALGLTSAYNPSIVRSVELYKAAFPAKYGGKVSSILAVNSIEPTLAKLTGEAEIGLLSSKMMVNIPVLKNKLGIYVAGRISNFTPFLKLANSFTEKNDTHIGIAFTDLNAGMKYKADDKNEFKFDFFRISDSWNVRQKDFEDLTTMLKENKQQNIALSWDYTKNEKIQNQLKFYVDNFVSSQSNKIDTELKNQPSKTYEQAFSSGITSCNFSDNFSFQLHPAVKLSLGASYQLSLIHPLSFVVADSAVIDRRKLSDIHFNEASSYVQTNFNIADKHKFSIGLRAVEMGSKKLFFSLEPRINYQIQLPEKYSLGFSVSKMTQAIHRVANSGLGLPLEIFVPSSENLVPEESWIASLGGGKEINLSEYRISLKTDLWYKQLKNILEFQDGMDAYRMLMQGNNVYDADQRVVTYGKGKAYGLDFSFSVNKKKTSLIVDYTLMRAVNQFAELNNGKPFDASTDIRNTLSLTLSHKFAYNLLLSANWQFNSGRPITVPTQVLPHPNINLENNTIDTGNNLNYDLSTMYLFLYGERNNYRTRAFHKLDISLTKNFLIKRRFQSSFSIGLYNAYNQLNPFMYNVAVNRNSDGTYRPVLNSVSVFPIMPSFSIRMKF